MIAAEGLYELAVEGLGEFGEELVVLVVEVDTAVVSAWARAHSGLGKGPT